MFTLNNLLNYTIKLYNLANYLLCFFLLLLYFSLKTNRKKNVNLINYKKSKKCYICGNGPSLIDTDLTLLDGDSIVVNDFFRLKEKYITFVPTYYCVVDSLYAMKKFSDKRDMLMNAYPNTPLILSSKYMKLITKLQHKKNIFFICEWGNLFNRRKRIDFSKLLPAGHNVICFCIFLAIYLGYDEIFLLGCDYNLFATQQPTHCYKVDDGSRKKNLLDIMFRYCFVTYVHYELAEYAKLNNIIIKNLSKKSLLDAYNLI